MIDFQPEDRTQQRLVGGIATLIYAVSVLLLLLLLKFQLLPPPDNGEGLMINFGNVEEAAPVYEISGNFGVFVAVDDKYSALIPAREATGKYRPGAILDLRVTEVKEDGKMNVSDRQKAYIQINEDAESVFSVIEEFAGVLPFDDHASPEVIKREFGLSKNAFKRAVGHLMKEGKVEIRDKRIYIKK